MRNFFVLSVAAGVVFVFCEIWSSDTSANPPSRGGASSAPASSPAGMVPDEVIAQMQALFKDVRGESGESQMQKIVGERAKRILELGAKAEKDYPDAPNLFVVRLGMIGAAEFLAPNDELAAGELVEVAGRLLVSKAPDLAKLRADVILTRARILRATSPDDVDKEILALADRYAKGDQAANALMQAAILAVGAKRNELVDSLVAKIKDGGYLKSPGICNFLVKARRLPFTAEMMTLDGATVKLPDDVKGKVVVICFWASGARACHAIVDQMKELYPKYKPLGVEFISVALDAPNQAANVKKFVSDKGFEWLQTFSAKATDPTAAEYQIRTIPTVWILDKNGMLMCTNGHENLPKFLDGVVRYCSSQPAGGATSQPASVPAMTK